jgi:hypothetical protein
MIRKRQCVLLCLFSAAAVAGPVVEQAKPRADADTIAGRAFSFPYPWVWTR